VGTLGEKIEANFKIHVAPDSYQRNIAMCFNRGSVQVQRAILDPIASSEVVLTEEEKETGVALVDIGGGTTKISIFYEGVLCHTSMVPFGGNVVTMDIKEGCAITVRQAESLKVQFGQAIADFAPEDKVVTIPINGWEPKQISFKSLAHIIQARMEEIVVQFFYQIRKSGYVDKLGAGIVITGGTSLLPNMGQLVKFHTGFDVRVGKPTMHTFVSTKGVNDPRFATVLGLLKLASEEDKFNGKNGRWKMKRVKEKSNEPGMFTKVQKKFTQGLLNFFEEETADTEMT
jgi:cell division protein FtsA